MTKSCGNLTASFQITSLANDPVIVVFDDGVASSEGGQGADNMKGLCNVLQSLVFLAQLVTGRECQAFLETLGLFSYRFQGSAWGLCAHPLKQVIGFLLLLVQSVTDRLVQPQLKLIHALRLFQ